MDRGSILRSECLFNGEKLHVSEVYHVVEGKQINIENKVELFRRLGREKKLYCPCGCGENVVLVAGPKNVRRQHFRLIGDFASRRCEYEEEGELSISAKGALKCWLEEAVGVPNPTIKYRVPICDIEDSERKFELTFYEPVKDFGVVYARLDSTVATKKIELIGEFAHTKVLFVAADFNEDTDGQYPEYMIRIQKSQGFCAYLVMDQDTPYEEIELAISLYEKDVQGLWELIPVLVSPLSKYEIGADKELYCNGHRIADLVAGEKENFDQKQQIRLARIKEELKRQDALRAKWEREEEEREKRALELRIAAEAEKKRREEEYQKRLLEKQQEAAAQKEQEEKAFFLAFPKYKKVYDILSSIPHVEGKFASDQSDGRVKQYRMGFDVVELRMNKERHYIEIKGKRNSDKLLFFVAEEGYGKLVKPGTGAAYDGVNLIGVADSEIAEKVKSRVNQV